MCSSEYRNWIVGGASGTTVKHTSPSKILSFISARPPQSIIDEFISKVISIIFEIENNQVQNAKLSSVLSILLSKMASNISPQKVSAI